MVIILATGAYAVLQLRVDQITDSLKKKQPLNTLFIFSDGEKALFFEVFFYNPETRKGSLFYVPPNLGSVIATINRVEGIDALYRRTNPVPLKRKIEDLLGVPLQGVIDIGFDDAGRLVDLMGGVDVFIPNPVDLTLPGPPRSSCRPAASSLDGDKARDFISYQDPLETDADAVGRRQKFLQAAAQGAGGERGVPPPEGAVPRCCAPSCAPTCPARALSSLVAEMGRFDSERMVLQRVLGTTRSVDGRDLLFPHQDGELLKQAVKQAMAANASNEFVPPDALTITVEVLNGTRTAGTGQPGA